MGRDVFLSVGGTANTVQEDFVQALEARLRAEGLNPNTVGRNTFSSDAPLRTIEELMDRCVGTVVVALERSFFPTGVEKRGGPNEKALAETSLATPWNQIEAAMSYSRRLPLLVVVDEKLSREGLLEPGYDWYVQSLPLDVGHLNTPEFNGVLASWKEKVQLRAIETGEQHKPKDVRAVDGKSIKERIENNLTIWFLGTLLTGFLTGIGTYEAVLRIAKLEVVSAGTATDRIADQYWLKITNVSFDIPGGEVEGIRVHGEVGNNPIAYPVRTLWAQPNADRTSSPYQMILTEQKTPLDIEVFAKTKTGEYISFYSISNVGEWVNISDLPYTHTVRACSNRDELMSTDGCVNVRIEIRDEVF